MSMQQARKPGSEPVDRQFMRRELGIATNELQTWVLFAVGLVSLHVIQFVLLQAPWTERDNLGQPNGVSSGWEIISNEVPGGRLVFASVLVLVASTFAMFFSLAKRSMPWMVVVLGLSLLRAALVWAAGVVAVDEAADRFSRYGIALSVVSLLVTAVVAGAAVSSFDD